jgi:hypothetical protein
MHILLAAAALALTPCHAEDLRNGPLGVSALRVSGGTCASAHLVAGAWVRKFRPGRLPRQVRGFTFEQRLISNSDTYYMRGVRGSATVVFDFVHSTCMEGDGGACAAAAQTCKSADLRFPFEPGAPKIFGVSQLRVSGGTCATAHRVAKEWGRRFRAEDRPTGPTHIPKKVLGFTFTSLPIHAVQELSLRGVKGSTRINFHYVIPNG